MVNLVECEPEVAAIDKVVASVLYENSGMSYEDVLGAVRNLKMAIKEDIIVRHAALRTNRRHKPSRAFEAVSYTFDLRSNFGMFRDIHRHRALTMQRQLLAASNGYSVPAEIGLLGIEDECTECMAHTKRAFDAMCGLYPRQAQYVVNFAYNYAYMMRLNLREACHLIELRTTPQGHADYRRMAQQMFGQIRNVHPRLCRIIKFADLKEYELERFEAEKRTAAKMSL